MSKSVHASESGLKTTSSCIINNESYDENDEFGANKASSGRAFHHNAIAALPCLETTAQCEVRKEDSHRYLLPTTVRTRSHFGSVANDIASTSLNRHDKGSEQKRDFKYAKCKVASDLCSLLTGAVPRFWHPGLRFAVVNLAHLSSKYLKFFNYTRWGAWIPTKKHSWWPMWFRRSWDNNMIIQYNCWNTIHPNNVKHLQVLWSQCYQTTHSGKEYVFWMLTDTKPKSFAPGNHLWMHPWSKNMQHKLNIEIRT